MTANEIDAEIAQLDDATRRYCAQRDLAIAMGCTEVARSVNAVLAAIDAERVALAQDMELPDDDIAEAAIIRTVERMVGFRALFVTLALAVFVAPFVMGGVL